MNSYIEALKSLCDRGEAAGSLSARLALETAMARELEAVTLAVRESLRGARA